MRKLLHIILLKIIKLQRKHHFIFINEHPHVETNVIYTFNHSCKHDTPYAFQVMKGHSWLLAGKQRLELIDRIAFYLNGTVWVDRKDKESKERASKRMLELLNRGESLLMFPEGTWNLTDSKPMLPLYWGCIDLARYSGCPIVPVVLEYVNDEVYITYGDAFYVQANDDKAKKIAELADTFATMKWMIWERFPVRHRSEVAQNEWVSEVDRRLREYPKLDYEYEKSCVRN